MTLVWWPWRGNALLTVYWHAILNFRMSMALHWGQRAFQRPLVKRNDSLKCPKSFGIWSVAGYMKGLLKSCNPCFYHIHRVLHSRTPVWEPNAWMLNPVFKIALCLHEIFIMSVCTLNCVYKVSAVNWPHTIVLWNNGKAGLYTFSLDIFSFLWIFSVLCWFYPWVKNPLTWRANC